MKTRPVGAELFHTDGETDVTKLTVAFRKIATDDKPAAASIFQNAGRT